MNRRVEIRIASLPACTFFSFPDNREIGGSALSSVHLEEPIVLSKINLAEGSEYANQTPG